MNNLKSLLFLLPGVVLLIAGTLLCIDPALKFPGAEKQLRNQKNKLTRLVEAINKGKLENQKLSTELRAMPEIRKGSVSLTADGSIVLRERLDNAAAKSQILIRTVGDIQKRVIAEESLMLYEVNFTAECTLKEFITLVSEFENNSPRVYWRNLTLRPNISHKDNELLILSGTAAIIALEAENEQ